MCKILAFTNSSKLNIRNVSLAASVLLLESEKDGFGYAVQAKDGQFGEKCIANFFSYRMKTKNEVQLPIVEVRQSRFGHYSAPTGGAIFHGRTSTNDKGLKNCHPMQREGWNLIHNGVVTDYGPAYKKSTSNDSEDVLARLILGIKEVEENLSGYYAFAALAPDGTLHIGRDDVAQLYVAWISSVESYIFATTKDLIEGLCEALELTHGPIDKVQDNVYVVFKGNDLQLAQPISPLGWSRSESKYASKSLGRALPDYDYSGYGGYSAGGDYGTNSATGGYFDATKGETLPKEVSEPTDPDEAMLQELMDEISDMDASYEIKNGYGEIISVHEFYKLDMVSQCECTITRGDGTRVDAELLFNWSA